jgi:hypothetical protein
MLSPRFLTQHGTTQASEPGHHEAAVPCLVCHRPGGPAPSQEVATHPAVALANILQTTDPGYMPLFNANGKPDPVGQITCRTCHLSHGQTALLQAAATNPSPSPDEQRAIRAQLRPFVSPNLCTQCHGGEARQKFLFFHDGKQRKK